MVDEPDQIIEIEGKDNSPPPDEGLPAWMATFADMVTLLLCFFVLLLSFANQDLSNFEMLRGSITEAFGVQKMDQSMKKVSYSSQRYENYSRADTQKLMGLAMQLKAFVEAKNLNKVVGVNTDQNGVLMRVSSRALFDEESAVLKKEAVKIIGEVIKTLNKNPDFNLVVQGHTDNTPPKGGTFSSNWILSSERAAAALHYILKHSRISPSRLKAVGYADTRPILPNNSEKNRSLNRRVEFYFIPAERENW